MTWFFFLILRNVAWCARGAPAITKKAPKLISGICLSLLILNLAGNLFAQSNTKLKGHVYDNDDGSPITGAVVELLGTGGKTTTDNFGRFRFDYLSEGEYAVVISASGYDFFKLCNINIVSDVARQIDIKLTRKTYYLDKITVRGKRIRLSSNNIEVFRRHRIESSNARNLPELLEKVPGVYMQRIGIASGKSQVKIRGSDSKHVLVLLDGQKINPSGSGIADLATIPLDIVERVEIHKGGASAEFGPDALGGVVNIITQQRIVSNGLSIDGKRAWGSWKTEIYNMTMTNLIPSDKFSCRFAYNKIESIGDFNFSYKVYPNPEPVTGQRKNNFVDSYNYFMSGIYQFNTRLKLSYSAQYYRSYNGLPDRARRQNEYAKSTDRRKLIDVNLQYDRSTDNNMKTNFSFSRYEQRYVDDSSRLKYDSRYTNDIFTIRHVHNRVPRKDNKIRIGAEFRREILYHSEHKHPTQSMGKTIRDDAAIFITDEQRFDISKIIVADNIAFDASLRFDWIETRKDSTSVRDTVKTNDVESWSPKIGVALAKGDCFSYILRASYGKSLRLPSMNSLFWIGGTRSHGNPGLKPEKSEHSEAGYELKGELGPVSLSGGMTYFHSLVKGLVIWRPYVGVWQPVNMEKAQLTGHEDFIELSLYDKTLSVLYQNTITTALNKSPGHTIYNKRLVFYPHYIQSLTVRLDYKFLYASYSIRWVDSTYTLTSNTKYYESYRLDDFCIGVKFDITGSWHLAADYKLHNVRNESYVLMTHYPMPGREYDFGISIAYGIKESH